MGSELVTAATARPIARTARAKTTRPELEDVQHFLVTRTPALAARYEFLSFETAEAGRRWLGGMVDKVGTVASVGASSPDARWIAIAFTWDGLRALGVSAASLATFPAEFREGLAARAELLGITGRNHPERWDRELTAPAFHALVILFAGDVAERERCRLAHAEYRACSGRVRLLGALDLHALAPLGEGHEHLGHPDRGPAALTRNGSYLAYLRMQEHVGIFREFLATFGGPTPEEQARLAAELRGRWRDGAPLVIARQPVIRRGGTYGPPLPPGAAEDGVDRGIAGFMGCGSLIRQFELAMGKPANEIPGLPAFTTIRGGAYLLLPGIRALQTLAGAAFPSPY